MGLPGSGKTHFLNNMGDDWHKIDDPMAGFGNFPENCEKLAIADPWFCMEATRNVAMDFLKNKYPDSKIELVFFENDPEKCKKNAALRQGKIVDEFINNFTKYYNPPNDAIKIYVKGE